MNNEDPKYYSEKQVGVAAFLGGPIASGILIYKNLKKLGKEKESLLAIGGILVFTILLVYLLLKIPDSPDFRLLNQIGPSIIGLIMFALYRFFFSVEFIEGLKDKSKI